MVHLGIAACDTQKGGGYIMVQPGIVACDTHQGGVYIGIVVCDTQQGGVYVGIVQVTRTKARRCLFIFLLFKIIIQHI